jgi:hypothetical protein
VIAVACRAESAFGLQHLVTGAMCDACELPLCSALIAQDQSIGSEVLFSRLGRFLALVAVRQIPATRHHDN